MHFHASLLTPRYIDIHFRVDAILTDLVADLTQDVLLGPDQRLLKPFLDIRKNRGDMRRTTTEDEFQ